MPHQRVAAVDHIRGLAMLGVVGIHTGAYALANPHANIHIVAILEICTRFAVPIFFFISAFGLFWGQDRHAPFSYQAFWRRRVQAVVVPYIVWSFIYLFHYALTTGDYQPLHYPHIVKYLFFGLGSYQLYFLVILIWFYLLLPLWRQVLPPLAARPRPWLAVLLAGQIAFNFYSSYILRPDFTVPIINTLVKYRLSYWPWHYIFIFLLGGICAARYRDCRCWLAAHRRVIAGLFLLSLGGLLGLYYWLLTVTGYTLEEAVNTAHQLSPPGVLYTLAATLLLLAWLDQLPASSPLYRLLDFLAAHSYVVYLVHPFVMYYLQRLFAAQGLIMTVPAVALFYLFTVTACFLISYALTCLGRVTPPLALLLTGSRPHGSGKPSTASLSS